MARIQLLDGADLGTLAQFETIIDVRSPAEFAEDHAPGAVNLPVLTNAERAEVGTIYVQESRLKANRIGAAYVARNIAHHLETALADKPPDFAPLVYCWRGGQRSESMATILSRIGWRTSLLVGGYRTYRRAVQASLYETPWPFRVILLDGDTGSAKTEILGRLADRGCQVLDLEGLAGHRGSLLGAWPGQTQPSQKMFESRLWAATQRLDPARPMIVEAESSKIGDRMVPPSLWRAMRLAPQLELAAPVEVRARYLVRAYGDLITDQERFEAALARLPPNISKNQLKAWRSLFEVGDFISLAQDIVADHYDPAYARSRRKGGHTLVGVVKMATMEPDDQDAAADAIMALAQDCPDN